MNDNGVFTTRAVAPLRKCLTEKRADVAPADEPYPEELAVTVCGDLTLYAAAVGSPVAVDYIVRVFSFEKDGKKMYGNDVYATAIQPWQA